jgi:hypothetical protein
MANITGWGRGTWGQLTFGEPIPVVLTGVAGTSALGSETVTGDANITETGLAATSGLGSVTGKGSCNRC